MTLSPLGQRIKAKQPAPTPTTPKPPYIPDLYLYSRFREVNKHMTTPITDARVTAQKLLLINQQVLLAGKKQKMRIAGYLDWVYYSPKTLAFAIETNQAEDYYWYQMNDPRSDPNVWKDINEEVALKEYYAKRAGKPIK